MNDQLTVLVAVDFSEDNFAFFRQLFLCFFRRLVPNWSQHVAESAPVRVEIDEYEFIVGCKIPINHSSSTKLTM